MTDGVINMPRTGMNLPVPELSPRVAAVAVTVISLAFVVRVLLEASGLSVPRKRVLFVVATALCAGTWFLAILQPHRMPSGLDFPGMCMVLVLAILGCSAAAGVLAHMRGRRPVPWGLVVFGACVVGFALGLLVAGWLYQIASAAGTRIPPAGTNSALIFLPFAGLWTATLLVISFLLRRPGKHG